MRLGVLVATLLFAATTDAPAALLLDQDNFPATEVGSGAGGTSRVDGFGVAQTFTVGIEGELAHIGVELNVGPGVNVSMSLLTANGSVPTFNYLGTFSAISAAASKLTFFDVTSLHLDVFVGDVLVFEVYAGHPVASATSYLRGSKFFRNAQAGITNWTPAGADFIFETYVETAAAIAEPATIALLGTGLLGVGWIRRRKRQV
jgi:hypothetical protein